MRAAPQQPAAAHAQLGHRRDTVARRSSVRDGAMPREAPEESGAVAGEVDDRRTH